MKARQALSNFSLCLTALIPAAQSNNVCFVLELLLSPSEAALLFRPDIQKRITDLPFLLQMSISRLVSSFLQQPLGDCRNPTFLLAGSLPVQSMCLLNLSCKLCSSSVTHCLNGMQASQVFCSPTQYLAGKSFLFKLRINGKKPPCVISH